MDTEISAGACWRLILRAPRTPSAPPPLALTDRPRRRFARAPIAAAALVVALGWTMGPAARPALAACHRFDVVADPVTVFEGQPVQVTVSRDGAVNPSQVDVATVDGTARGGEDHESIARTIAFSTETIQTFTLTTFDDGVPEPDETFTLRLANPAGCPVNTRYSLGPEAIVTIVDNDTVADPAAEPAIAAPTGPAPDQTPGPAASASDPSSPGPTDAATTDTPPPDGTLGQPTAQAGVLETEQPPPMSPAPSAAALGGSPLFTPASQDPTEGVKSNVPWLAATLAAMAIAGSGIVTLGVWRRQVRSSR